MYFHKIAAAVGMQSIVAVSSVKQMIMALRLPGVKMISINNRNMATWALDTTRVSRILGDAEGEWAVCSCVTLGPCRLTTVSLTPAGTSGTPTLDFASRASNSTLLTRVSREWRNFFFDLFAGAVRRAMSYFS